jgi:hypothetical protein
VLVVAAGLFGRALQRAATIARASIHAGSNWHFWIIVERLHRDHRPGLREAGRRARARAAGR